MSSSERRSIVGIDLGTTQSVIAHLGANGVVSVLPNRDGDMLTPSAVYLDGQNSIVGKSARRAAAHTPDKVATIVKRDIGKAIYSREVDGRRFPPETLSAIILRKLKQDAERRIAPISRAVITVPAFFDDARRKATEDAGKIAGFEMVDIINEPTAAALAYCLEGQLDKNNLQQPDFPGGELTALVYDLGGGTFDVTAIHMQTKRITTLATDGAVKLGGKDWDDRITQFIIDEFQSRYGVKLQSSEALLQHSEATKHLLSDLPSAPLNWTHQGHTLDVTLTREHFNEMTRDLLAQTEAVTNLVVEQSRKSGRQLNWSDFDRVLLVGGSTRMPMVRKMVARLTGKPPDDSADPDQVVARGAAVYGAILASQDAESELELEADVQEELEDIGVVAVNAHSLGIAARHPRTKEPVTAVLIPKNRQLPYSVSRVFFTTEGGATSVRVRVLEGEAPDPDGNIQLGKCKITELPPNLPRRSPVQVRLSYGANGRVSVMALDMTGGRFAHAEIQRTSGLSELDIRRETEFVDSLQIQ